MSPNLEHIAIKVDDVEAAVASLRRRGFTLVAHELFPGIGLELAELELGNMRVEVLRSAHDGSPIASDGCGLHHIAIRVDDLEAAYQAALADQDVQLVRPPAPGRTGKAVFFVRILNGSMLLEYVS